VAKPAPTESHLPTVVDKAPADPSPAANPSNAPAPDGAPLAADKAPRDNRAPLEMTNVSEREWMASVRQKLAEKLDVDPGDLKFSPSKRRWAVVRDPAAGAAKAAEAAAAKAPPSKKSAAPRHPVPRRYQIIVADTEGKVETRLRPITVSGSDEPPKDFRFLNDDNLIYEVVKPAPPAAKPTRAHDKKRSKGKAEAAKARDKAGDKSEPDPEKRLFVIQPLGRRPKPLRCEGIHFAWSPQHTHLASVGGPAKARFVAVDGVKVYPRRGASRISGPPAWSKDGTSLAFVENRPEKPARLVLLAEYDNPTGDTFWDLPPGASMDGAQAYFTGHDRLVVGKSALKPLFAAPFTKEKSATFDP
jgi:hypothetical protein